MVRRWAGLPLIAAFAVGAGVSWDPTSGLVALVTGVIGWLAVGRYFCLPVACVLVPVALTPYVGRWLFAVCMFPAVVIGCGAAQGERFWSAPLVGLDPSSVALQPAVIEALAAVGFAPSPVGAVSMGSGRFTMATFSHPDAPMYADVSLHAPKQVKAVSMRSHLADGGTLTTTPHADLLTGPQRLRQTFPRAPIDELVARHRDGLAWLAAQGRTATPADAATYFAEITWINEDSRRIVRAHPLRVTAYTLAVRLLRVNLDRGPIQDRRG